MDIIGIDLGTSSSVATVLRDEPAGWDTVFTQWLAKIGFDRQE